MIALLEMNYDEFKLAEVHLINVIVAGQARS